MRKARVTTFGFSASLLVLAMAAGPASAEPITLVCKYVTDGGGSFTYRIDYATGRFEQIGPSGNAYSNRITTATVSPNTISWLVDQPSSYLSGDNVSHPSTEHWEGRIDRLATSGWVQSYYVDLYHNAAVSFTCAKAAAAF